MSARLHQRHPTSSCLALFKQVFFRHLPLFSAVKFFSEAKDAGPQQGEERHVGSDIRLLFIIQDQRLRWNKTLNLRVCFRSSALPHGSSILRIIYVRYVHVNVIQWCLFILECVINQMLLALVSRQAPCNIITFKLKGIRLVFFYFVY